MTCPFTTPNSEVQERLLMDTHLLAVQCRECSFAAAPPETAVKLQAELWKR